MSKYVTPIGDFNCQSFPLDDNFKYLLTDEEEEKLSKHLLRWDTEDYIDNGVVVKHPILVPNDNTLELQLENARKELAEIHQWFIDNDWKINKIVIGEWETDDARWLEYLEERATKRARQDELNSLLAEE